MACPAGYSLDDLYRPVGSFISDNLQIGQRVVTWNYPVTWTEKHVRARDLEPYRMQGDPLSDEALQALNVKRKEDAYEALLAYVQRPIAEQESDAPRRFMEESMELPEWVDWEQLRRGQQVFWKYIWYISIGLVHFSLTGLNNAPKFARVIGSTGYLTGNSSNARVTETGQFIFDMMRSVDDLKPGTGYAWKSIVRVRLLHSQVRLRLVRLSKAHNKFYSVERYGIPINQEDLASTLFFLSTAMWRIMDYRLGILMQPQEKEDLLHVWRYIGFYMGIDRQWDPAYDAVRSDAIYESIMMHISDPSEQGGKKASNMLFNLVSVMPLPYGLHMAISEMFFGPDMWHLMGHKPSPWYHRLSRWLLLSSFYLDLITFSQWQWWCEKRADLVRAGLEWLIRSELGERSVYAYHKDPSPEHDGTVYLKAAPQTKGAMASFTKRIRSTSWWLPVIVLGVVAVGYIFVNILNTRVVAL